MARFAAWSLAVFTGVALAVSSNDLGSVLQEHQNLTTFYNLIKNNSDVLLELPSYNGVTPCPQILAPSDKAFEDIPYTSLNGVWDPNDHAKTTAFLQYHVIRGSVSVGDLEAGPTYLEPTLLTGAAAPAWTNVTAGQNVLLTRQPGDAAVLTSGLGARCTIIERDLDFRGGRVQVVDHLLMPPAPLRQTAEAFQAGSFVAALYAAGLMPDVGDRPNVTVFAPRDAAVDLVGGSLRALDRASLSRVAAYHVVPGRVLSSADLANGSVLATLGAGGSGNGTAPGLTVRQEGNNKFVNTAQIVQPDILLANGIMHLVADVLNPDATAAAPNASAPTQAPAFPVSVASSPFASALPCTTNCPSSTGGATASPTTTTAVGGKSKSSENPGVPAPTVHAAVAALGVLGAGLLL
ncbi:beta-Ig-H3/Fasciclin [Cordyceps fumosorosea ARSEF 2679]|uniref:Beta-Ig-H3/Fasciclin n=1 Tax=Cordyceps fumosorosea (strain ARSEF 2679) TaxID=1081104 RepID=A0A167TKU4_CORFA|nr:beta-Ig-H3/Fasciclin [Cordyceps fumosorosea ARSEF 2679]OAA60704.1 beta-Ig-H3/Fasciclin [Cordyceps fumosorosea ARSEF 2679]